MKNVILLLGVISLMVACGPDYKSEVERLRVEQDSLLNVFNSQRTEMEGYLRDITDIQISLDDLTAQEQVLKAKSEGDINLSTKERIVSDLSAIQSTIKENKKRLAAMQIKLKGANSKIASLEKIITDLNNQLVARDSSINTLSKTIADLSLKVNSVEVAMSEVKADNEVKTREIADKTAKLNTAYYTIGTYKSLREKQVLSNEGSIFKSKQIDPNFNVGAFTKIDVTTTKVITLNSPKSIKVISTHPTDSYTIVKEDDKVKLIQVDNPDRFWANSKYLVIAIM